MKKLFLKLFGNKELKEALNIIDDAEKKFNNKAFVFVREHLEKMYSANPKWLKKIMKKNNTTIKEMTYNGMANFAGDLLESGKLHLYRGVLLPEGEDLLKLYEDIIDELILNNWFLCKFYYRKNQDL
jgi:hypothetical protein